MDEEKALKHIVRWCSCDNKWLSTSIRRVREEKISTTTRNGQTKKIWAIVTSFDYSHRTMLFPHITWRNLSRRESKINLVESSVASSWEVKELRRRWREIWNSSTLLSSVRQFIIVISAGNPAFKRSVRDVFTASSWNWLAMYNKELSWPLYPHQSFGFPLSFFLPMKGRLISIR